MDRLLHIVAQTILPSSLDAWAHIAELIAAGPILWKANRFMNKILDERENFPPHRHINGNILYPRGLKPENGGNNFETHQSGNT